VYRRANNRVPRAGMCMVCVVCALWGWVSGSLEATATDGPDLLLMLHDETTRNGCAVRVLLAAGCGLVAAGRKRIERPVCNT